MEHLTPSSTSPPKQASVEVPSGYQQANVIATQNLLEFAREQGIQQFVFASSSSIYGPRQRPDLAINKFVRLIEAGEPIPVFGETIETVIGKSAIVDRLSEQPGDVPQTWADVSKAKMPDDLSHPATSRKSSRGILPAMSLSNIAAEAARSSRKHASAPDSTLNPC